MNTNEFKAWFEGFCENIHCTPTDNQWKRIKDRVKEIDGTVTTEKVFVDRYINTPFYADNNKYMPRWNDIMCNTGIGVGSATLIGGNLNASATSEAVHFDSLAEFHRLGSADYAMLANA